MPWEFFFVMMTISVAFVIPGLLFSAWSEHNKRRAKLEQQESESLSALELEAMIEGIVNRALLPIEDRLDRVERRQQRDLGLDDLDAYEDEKSLGRTARRSRS